MRQIIDEASRLNGIADMQKDDESFTRYAAWAFAEYEKAARAAADTLDDIAAKLEAAIGLMEKDQITYALIHSALNDMRRFV